MAGRLDLRLVFDAAAKPHGRCLYDFVTSVSAFWNPLPAVLICFREGEKSFVTSTTVGALCAQSIGEPCTQMTLKPFQLAGVSSMNTTEGVHRYVTEYFQEANLPFGCFVLIKLDMNRIRLLKLEVDASSIRLTLCTGKLKLNPNTVLVFDEDMIVVQCKQSCRVLKSDLNT
ncbi:hypothetical protein DAPPUDRAFT_262889 [Daphnia pulex]|uniref:DNA-directed RNA polymerase n=1 Tax=Daphnia pulex TaxID=6669 RepID=E9HNV8_DAPPU|nr:hypothetical protein DAPPUDRAFT_262889 [Daphnia pulex]|eukprot:EFX66567.1 hypothetical protein DAPPUDRAFT_262889 [Daphnia pulex]